jgi:hypothetical protein
MMLSSTALGKPGNSTLKYRIVPPKSLLALKMIGISHPKTSIAHLDEAASSQQVRGAQAVMFNLRYH